MSISMCFIVSMVLLMATSGCFHDGWTGEKKMEKQKETEKKIEMEIEMEKEQEIDLEKERYSWVGSDFMID